MSLVLDASMALSWLFDWESLVRLARLPIDADEETFAHAWPHTWRLSREEHLTLYDAAYLEIALRRSLPPRLLRSSAVGGASAAPARGAHGLMSPLPAP